MSFRTNRPFKIVAKTMAGLEETLAEELRAIGATDVCIGRRMVSCMGSLAILYKANLHCRTALRILRPVYSFRATRPDEIYKKIKKMNWAEHLSPNASFIIDTVCFSEYFTHSQFITHRVKDAIVDYFTSREGIRPTIDRENPDLYINVHISHDLFTLSFDSSGESLHKRGYRVAQTEAPLNEVLAAGIILNSGWHGECDLIDPMCGSGTLAIEAALIARNIPPGVFRKQFAFEKWKNFDKELFEEIYNDDSLERPFLHKIIASDIDPRAIDLARKNINSAGVSKDIRLEVKSIADYPSNDKSVRVVITNPPYGDRLKEKNIIQLYNLIGERLKHAFTNSTAWILSHHQEHFKAIGLKHSLNKPLKNGAIDCQLRRYDIFEGKQKNKNKA